MPYAVASLLPLALFPMLNVIPGDEVGHNYFKVKKKLRLLFMIYLFLSKGYNNVISW